MNYREALRRVLSAARAQGQYHAADLVETLTTPTSEPQHYRTVHWVMSGEGLGNLDSFAEDKLPSRIEQMMKSGATYIAIHGRRSA